MEDIVIHIPAVPVAQPRGRAVSIGGIASIYQAPRSHPIHAFKATCRMAAIAVFSDPPLEEPIAVSVVFLMPRPKYMRWRKRPMPRIPHTTATDIDNLLKAVFDSLNGVLWTDDRLIYAVEAQKLMAAGDESPHVELTVRRR